MEEDFYSRMKKRSEAEAPPRTSSVLGVIIASILLGAAVTGLVAWQWGFFASDEAEVVEQVEPPQEELATQEPSPAPSEATEEQVAEATAEAEEAVEAVERVAEQQGGLEARVVAAERRLDQLALRAEAATGNAARAEGLLVAFATRRSIERGAELGYLRDQLELRFAGAQREAVDAVIAAADNPITIDRLRSSLDGLESQLMSDPQGESGWSWFKREMGQLFIIRRPSTTRSPAPRRRLERARLFLESGQVEEAVAEVRAMPGADQAGQWIEDAERFAAALRALDRLEIAAISEPRELRDAEGNRVEQLSPTSDN